MSTRPPRRPRPGSGPKPEMDQDDYVAQILTDLPLHIKEGKVVPIISNSLRNDRIFDINFDYSIGLPGGDQKDEERERLMIDEALAEAWADDLNYPLPDKHQLARIAVYNSFNSPDEDKAKRKYLKFLKNYILDLAYQDETVRSKVDELDAEIDTTIFSEIATRLGYPKYTDNRQDPLRRLAKLPLPLYVTTSYYDFMERALAAENRKPRTQISFLSGEPKIGLADEHKPDPDLELDVKRPLVYHLHGFERYPESMILSEDDYLDFLVKVWEEKNTQDFIPGYLQAALAESTLILLGYKLHAWDFRVLFRGLIHAQETRRYGLAIQLDPQEQREVDNVEKAREYLKKYFSKFKFGVNWSEASVFVEELTNDWDKRRTGS